MPSRPPPTLQDFKLEELSKYFHLPERAVAKELGICLTTLKKLCRSYGITRWPFCKVKSIQRTLALPVHEGAAAAFGAQQQASNATGGAAEVNVPDRQGSGATSCPPARGGRGGADCREPRRTTPSEREHQVSRKHKRICFREHTANSKQSGPKRRKLDPKRTLNTIFEQAVQAMWEQDTSFPFRSAVCSRSCPAYRELVPNPIGLEAIRRRCYGLGSLETYPGEVCRREALYDSKEEFVADVALMVSNCRTYNEHRDPQLVSDVLGLEQTCHAKLEEEKSAIMQAEAMLGLSRKLVGWTQALMTAEFEAFVLPVTIKGYTHEVKKPMDLSTMMSKAESYCYSSRDGWLEDLRLVRDNCHLFCATQHQDLPPIADELLARGETLARKDLDAVRTLEEQVGERGREWEREHVRQRQKARERKRERERGRLRKRVREGTGTGCATSEDRAHQRLAVSFRHGQPLVHWTREEEAVLMEAQLRLAKNWPEIAKLLPGRTPVAVRRRWEGMQDR